MDKHALWEAVKEPLRLLVLAVIPFGVAYSNQYDYQYAVYATLFLRFVDSYLHTLGKDRNSAGLVKGLTRF